MLITNVEALFNNFKEGINHLNLMKVVDCYHLPCTLNTPDKLSLINTKAERLRLLKYKISTYAPF